MLVVFLLAVFGCKSSKKSRDQKKTDNTVWVNPYIEPVIHSGITDIFKEHSDQERNEMNIQGLINFCNRMNTFFSQSNLTNTEAQIIYQYLYLSGQLMNEPAGMPDPEEIRPHETLEQFKSRNAIRKNANETYSIFFVRTGCGYTFYFGHFNIPREGKRLDFKSEEVWRASMPC